MTIDGYDDGFAEVLGQALSDDFAGASSGELEEAVNQMLGALGPAEAIGVGRAMSQVARAATGLTREPAFARVSAAALPVAGGSLGTLVGGPAGTAIGARLGTAAARAVPSVPPRSGPLRPAVPPRLAGGSPAAVRALVLSQHPDVLRGLLAAALGQRGKKVVNGQAVAALLSLLSATAGRAALDADELAFADGGADTDILVSPEDDEVYEALVAADRSELTEAVS